MLFGSAHISPSFFSFLNQVSASLTKAQIPLKLGTPEILCWMRTMQSQAMGPSRAAMVIWYKLQAIVEIPILKNQILCRSSHGDTVHLSIDIVQITYKVHFEWIFQNQTHNLRERDSFFWFFKIFFWKFAVFTDCNLQFFNLVGGPAMKYKCLDPRNNTPKYWSTFHFFWLKGHNT